MRSYSRLVMLGFEKGYYFFKKAQRAQILNMEEIKVRRYN